MKLSKLRGNDIYYKDNQWYYLDDDKPTAETWKDKPCGQCNLPNRSDEHDACLGELPNVINACCGHGNVDEAYIVYEDETIERGDAAIERFEELKNQCSEVSCKKPVMENSKLDCCEQHEAILIDSLDEEYKRNQQELYDDYIDDISLSMSNALARYHQTND